MIYNCLMLFWTFFKIGAVGFGGGYAMMSMIMTEGARFGVTMEQMADLNALDMVVPGPIAINAATYVGYLGGGIWGSVSATIGVMIPSLIIISIVMRFLDRYRENRIMAGVLTGVKPAAVGLIAAAAMQIGSGVLLMEGYSAGDLLRDPLHALSPLMVGIFVCVAVLNIKWKVNPILLTLAAGAIGAAFLR